MRPHKDWKVGVGEQPTLLIAEIINAHTIWSWLTKPGRVALLSAKGGNAAVGHVRTLKTLRHHGLLTADGQLTEAGEVVAKWNPPPKPNREPDRPAVQP